MFNIHTALLKSKVVLELTRTNNKHELTLSKMNKHWNTCIIYKFFVNIVH